MYKLTEIAINGEECEQENSGFIIGGKKAYVKHWPKNPKGEKLLHLFSIDCALVKEQVSHPYLPSTGYISVFSTYSEKDYFLDCVTYFGDDLEFNEIKAGYTFVSVLSSPTISEENEIFIPKCTTTLRDREINEESFPTFSFIAQDLPNGLKGIEPILDDYGFVCQVYSGDFPKPFRAALGLSDAIGYLFLKKEHSKEKLEGLFFVQTG